MTLPGRNLTHCLLKLFSHSGHLKGRSCVCVRKCRVKCSLRLNTRLQIGHSLLSEVGSGIVTENWGRFPPRISHAGTLSVVCSQEFKRWNIYKHQYIGDQVLHTRAQGLSEFCGVESLG